MKILFLGTSHGNPEANRFCSSALLTVGEKRYLIDAGAPVLPLLLSLGVRPQEIGGIFITHAHDDHYFGLVEYTRVVNRSSEYADALTPVFIPRRGMFRDTLKFSYDYKLRHAKRGTKFKVYKKGVVFDDGNIKVTAVPVKHIYRSFAFLVEAEGKKVFFSGDLARGMRDYPAFLFTTHTDLIVLEGAHTPLDSPEIVEKINRSDTDRLIVNHINPHRATEAVLSSFFGKIKRSVDCQAAFDGMEIEL